ncbi:hypothetical protein D3C81_2161340 [compost metagenome]
MRFEIASVQYASMNVGVERLHPTVEHLRELCHVTDFDCGDSLLFQQLVCTARRDDLKS